MGANIPQPQPEPLPAGPLLLAITFGRTDAGTCNDAPVPDLGTTWPELVQQLGGAFGMTTREVVALVGAHTVGSAHAPASGFAGEWSSYASSFDNAYFKGLVNVGWNQRPANRDVWNDNRGRIALTIDVETAVTPSGACASFGANLAPRGGSVCPINNQAINDVRAFAENGANGAWHASFRTAWAKLTAV